MKIGVWPALLKFFDFLSQKLIRTTLQNSHQTCKKLNVPHVIRPSSPVTNLSCILTNINLSNLDDNHSIKAESQFYYNYFSCISSHFKFWTAFCIIILIFFHEIVWDVPPV